MSQELTNDARDFLEELELKGLLNNEKKVLEFCCGCCRLIYDKLPDNARNALTVSESYLNNLANSQDLENARVALWNDLGKDYMNLNDSRVAGIRAVICCLYEIKTIDDAFSTADYVMGFSNCVEIKCVEQLKLLQEIFSH